MLQGPCYAVKCLLLLQLIGRTTWAGCSVDHHGGGAGMNYPTTTASGTWTTRGGGISSYGWDSQQPVDPCSRCTNVPPPLPGSQYTTQSHLHGYGANDRVGVSGYSADDRVGGYVSDNRIGGGSDDRGGGGGVVGYANGRPSADYGSTAHFPGTGHGNAGTGHYTDNRVNVYTDHTGRYPDGYRGNGYDNLSPEWNRRHGNRKSGGAGGGYSTGGSYVVGTGYSVAGGTVGGIGGGGGGYHHQGTAYPADGQGMQAHGNYNRRPPWNVKGAYPVKVEPGYWQSQPPKDIGWDEDSKKVGVVMTAGWIGGPKKPAGNQRPYQYQTSTAANDNDKNDDRFNKGTGYDDRKKPYMGWGGSGSYEVIKINNGYKYVDKNSNGDYGSAHLGNSYGYGGGQSNNNNNGYNGKPSPDYGSKPGSNVDYDGRPYQGGHQVTSQSPHNEPSTVYDYGSTRPPPTQGHGKPQNYYGTGRPAAQEWSTSRPIAFQVVPSSRPPSQRPHFPVQIASRPTQHWGENSFNEQLGGGYNSRPGGNYEMSGPDYGHGQLRPDHGYGSSRPNYGHGSSRPDHGYGGSSTPDYGYGSSTPDYDYGSSRPDHGYGSSRPDHGTAGGRPYAGSTHHPPSGYGSQTSEDFDKFGGFTDNSGGGRPQVNNRPGSYDNDGGGSFTNGNDVYGSQQQQQQGYSKGYASNWDYYSNSMR